MRILITGNQGYIGPGVVRRLRRELPGAYLIGYDTGFFALSTTNASVWPERALDEQHTGDVRELPERLLEGVDGVESQAGGTEQGLVVGDFLGRNLEHQAFHQQPLDGGFSFN